MSRGLTKYPVICYVVSSFGIEDKEEKVNKKYIHNFSGVIVVILLFGALFMVLMWIVGRTMGLNVLRGVTGSPSNHILSFVNNPRHLSSDEIAALQGVVTARIDNLRKIVGVKIVNVIAAEELLRQEQKKLADIRSAPSPLTFAGAKKRIEEIKETEKNLYVLDRKLVVARDELRVAKVKFMNVLSRAKRLGFLVRNNYSFTVAQVVPAPTPGRSFLLFKKTPCYSVDTMTSVPDDLSIDHALRPMTWDEYVGQEKAKKNLRVIIEAASARGEAMDHVLFAGPAGLGKTTLAYLVAKELGRTVRTTSGPALEKMGDLAAILTNLEPYEVLFIDEAHRINRLIEEVLYPAMEARKLHLMIGKGPSARSLTLDLPPFTLIAATTRENLLSNPLRSRFGATFRLEYYDIGDIEKIIARSAKVLSVNVDLQAVAILAKAARRTPRVANRLLKRARDFMEVYKKKTIDEEVARNTLDLLEIDNVGLEPHDRKLLSLVVEKFGGGPVGLGTLAAALSEERGVIEEIYEPYLMSLGFLQRTPQGRTVLSAAYEHLGLRRKGELL